MQWPSLPETAKAPRASAASSSNKSASTSIPNASGAVGDGIAASGGDIEIRWGYRDPVGTSRSGGDIGIRWGHRDPVGTSGSGGDIGIRWGHRDPVGTSGSGGAGSFSSETSGQGVRGAGQNPARITRFVRCPACRLPCYPHDCRWRPAILRAARIQDLKLIHSKLYDGPTLRMRLQEAHSV